MEHELTSGVQPPRPAALRRHRSHSVTPFHPDWLLLRELNRDVRWAIEHYARGTVLDIGCGGRPYEEPWPGVSRWLGLDRDTNDLADIRGTASQIPLPDGSVDTVLCTQVLEHVNEPALAMREFARVLTAQGIAIISVPQYWPLHEEPYDFFRYTEPGLLHLTQSSGFELIAKREQGRGAIVAGQALNNSILCAGDTHPWHDRFAFKASKAPLYLCVNVLSLLGGTVLKTGRDVINRLFVVKKHA